MIDAETINAAFQGLAETTDEYATAEQAKIKAKSELDIEKANGLADGSITGSNADKREASAREAIPEWYAAFDHVDSWAKEAKLALDLARIEVERVKTLLRLMEISSRGLFPYGKESTSGTEVQLKRIFKDLETYK